MIEVRLKSLLQTRRFPLVGSLSRANQTAASRPVLPNFLVPPGPLTESLWTRPHSKPCSVVKTPGSCSGHLGSGASESGSRARNRTHAALIAPETRHARP